MQVDALGVINYSLCLINICMLFVLLLLKRKYLLNEKLLSFKLLLLLTAGILFSFAGTIASILRLN